LLFYRLISQAVQTEHTLTHELFTENSGGAK
jgi:hypothetical protein